jgi:hypothetical protein
MRAAASTSPRLRRAARWQSGERYTLAESARYLARAGYITVNWEGSRVRQLVMLRIVGSVPERVELRGEQVAAD